MTAHHLTAFLIFATALVASLYAIAATVVPRVGRIRDAWCGRPVSIVEHANNAR